MFRNFIRPLQLVLISYFGIIIYLFLQAYITNYAHSDGILLANQRPVGADFPIFYVAGKLFLTDRDQLYDYSLQLKLLGELFHDTPHEKMVLVFVYPPPVAALFSIVSQLSLLQAYLAWTSISLIISVAAIILLLKKLSLTRVWGFTLFLSSAAFVPFLSNCLGSGQLSTVGLMIIAVCYICRRSQRPFWEGIALGFGFYKPPLFIFAAIISVLTGRWWTVAGAALSSGLLLLFSFYLVGYDVMLDYFLRSLNYRYGQELVTGVKFSPALGVGLHTWLALTFGNEGLRLLIYLVIFLICLAIVLRINKTKESDLAFCLEYLCSIFLSVQVVIYDLTLLLPVFLIISAKLIKERSRALIPAGLAVACLHLEWLFREQHGALERSSLAPSLMFLLMVSLVYAIVANFNNKQRSYG